MRGRGCIKIESQLTEGWGVAARDVLCVMISPSGMAWRSLGLSSDNGVTLGCHIPIAPLEKNSKISECEVNVRVSIEAWRFRYLDRYICYHYINVMYKLTIHLYIWPIYLLYISVWCLWNGQLDICIEYRCYYAMYQLTVHLSTCPPDHLSTCPPDHLTTWQPVHLSIWPPVHLTTFPSVHLTTCPPDHLTKCPPSV